MEKWTGEKYWEKGLPLQKKKKKVGGAGALKTEMNVSRKKPHSHGITKTCYISRWGVGEAKEKGKSTRCRLST